MIRGSKVKIRFDPDLGGMIVEDSLDLLQRVSIEIYMPGVDRPEDYNQSYKCPNPKITWKKDWVLSQGKFSSDEHEIPVEYAVYTLIKGLNVILDFKVTFEEALNVGLLKIWCYVSAVKVIVEEQEGGKAFMVYPAGRRWTPVYAGKANKVSWLNYNGSLQLFSKSSTYYVNDRVFKHQQTSEYVMVMLQNPQGQVIPEGSEFRSTWQLKYSLGGP